jgi:RNA polymerase sigma-70 factor (ECF subfamily)
MIGDRDGFGGDAAPPDCRGRGCERSVAARVEVRKRQTVDAVFAEDGPTGEMGDDDDAQLVEDATRGRREAHRLLYARHRDAVARLADGFGRFDTDEVADVVQETFIRAFESLPQLRERAHFRAWLLTIARNRCLSRAVAHATDRKAHAALALVPREEPAPASVLLSQAEEVHLVRQLIDALPEGAEKRTVIRFYVEGELSLREIAEDQGETKSAVAMRLDRFRARFKLQLLARLADPAAVKKATP